MFCYISKPNNSTSQQVNNSRYEKAVMTSMLPVQQCVGNSAYCQRHMTRYEPVACRYLHWSI